jgi:hypothetical protein
MKPNCKNCNHWKELQNKGTEVEEQKVGGCFKLQRALVELNLDNPFNISFKWIGQVSYTIQLFGCNMFSEKEIVRKRTK